ncbi:MAG TPA: diguanylate cyclase [Dongiaceae bacterium]|jgi:diguanylate cyclase (GGDEF)-like protein
MPAKDIPQVIRLLLVGGNDAVAQDVERLNGDGEEQFSVQRVVELAEAPRQAEASSFDAMILDLTPILKDGLARAESVVAKLATYAPVTVLSGDLDRTTEQTLRRAGAVDCLFENEVTPRALRRSIRLAVAGGDTGKKVLPRLFDPTTGLATQFLFWEILGLAARRAKRNRDFFALLLIEVIGLPSSDEVAGNEIMQIAAERASTSLRGSDTVARFEHSQLAILVESMPRMEDIQIVAEKLVLELGKPYPIAGGEQHYSINLGISLFPTSAENADTLIGKAFEALANSKSRGKDQYVFA